MSRDTEDPQRIKLTITRKVVVHAEDGKPALELESANGNVKVRPLPQNSGNRQAVALADLAAAVNTLQDAPG